MLGFAIEKHKRFIFVRSWAFSGPVLKNQVPCDYQHGKGHKGGYPRFEKM